MLAIIISILICYGFVLIITRGSIFEGPRDYINDLKVKYENWFFIDRSTAIELLSQESTDIDAKFIELYKKIQLALDNPEYPKLFEELINKIHENIIFNRSKNYILKKWMCFYPLKCFNKLINCQMCLGFWSGIALAVFTIFNPIALFGNTIQIVSNLNYISIVLFGLLISGTTWAIDQIVEFFSNNQK